MIQMLVNWKTVAAIGASVVSIIVVVKLDGEGIKEVLIHATDCAKEQKDADKKAA